MAPTGSELVRLVLAAYRARRREYATLALVAAVVMMNVAMGLIQRAIAMNQTEKVLDCPYAGSGAHTHDASCYDASGNLVCPLDEREYHVHDESCYNESHELTCTKDEVTETHIHGPGCFREVVTDDNKPTNAKMPAQSFSQQLKDDEGKVVLRVDVDAPKGALPAGTTMRATWVEPSSLTKKEQKAVDKAIAKKTGGKVVEQQQAVDITFLDDQGQKVDPAKKLTVTFTSDLVSTKDEAMVVHIDDLTEKQLKEQQNALKAGKTAEEAEPKRTAVPVDSLSKQALAKRDMNLSDDQLAVESDQFSIYVLFVAKLEHTLEASDGETYTITLDAPEGAGIPDDAKLLVSEVYVDGDEHDEYEASAADALGVKENKVSLSRFFDIKIVDADGNEIQPAEPVQVRIELADAPEDAVADVVHFDSKTGEPEVVETSEDEGAPSFEATGFSVYGVVYTVVIEDDGVYTFEGDNYTIKVTCPEEANIPSGTELVVSELDPDSDEYVQHLGRLWAEVNKEYLEYEEQLKTTDPDLLDIPERGLVNIYQARFFDVTLVYEGEEVEPDVPVTVDVSFKQGLMATDEAITGAVHFTDEGKVELIDDVTTSKSDETFDAFTYQQESFSVTGTYMGRETQDIIIGPDTAPNPSVTLSADALDAAMRASASPKRGAASESPSTEDHSDLTKPVGNKTLTPNKYKDANNKQVEDGTYTLTLSVKGHSNQKVETVTKKSNVLFIMDRSSSMITKTVDNNQGYWYYGTWNTNETTFRGDIRPDTGYQFYGEVPGVTTGATRVEINGETKWLIPLNVSSTWSSWYNYNLTYFDGRTTKNYPQNYPVYVKSKTTRMVAEQNALSNLYSKLLAKNSAAGTAGDDTIEIAIISFGDQRFDLKRWKSETESNGWVKGRDTSPLTTVTNSNRFTSGTNWEEALQYANEVISAKKAADGADEDYYVVFLTDGEPTTVKGESGEAKHTTDPATGQITKGKGNIYAYNEAKDDAKALVDNGYKFYNIFTYRHGEDDTYSIYLTNYAYGNGNNNGNVQTDAVKNYFSDAKQPEDLVNAFNNIFSLIETAIGHGNVSITDTLTTDAMTTTVVHGKTNGYVYKVTSGSGDLLYSVTATGDLDNPAVTFEVPGTSGSSVQSYPAQSEQVGGKTVYKVTTLEGKEYKMALADINDSTGELTWDLSPIGILLDDCTYSVEFIVWPDQDAYDYVAALNNGLPSIVNSKGETVTVEWKDSQAHDSGKGYREGGVAQYPSIVKYPNGTFAVLTNKDQKLHYSVIESSSNESEPTVTGPFYSELPLPEPMPLKASKSSIEKIWNVSRDKSILAALLYPANGEHYKLTFEVMQGEETTPYTTVDLGWDEKKQAYVWDPASVDTVNYHGESVTIGTRWVEDFSIATGHMLSEARMNELGLDKTAYPTAQYGDVTYYILEPGHDYTIKEPDQGMGYEFDFVAPVYHPMLVDGVLKSVNMIASGEAISIDKIEDIAVDENGASSLKVENTLRGYIHLNKVVVDKDDKQVPSDTTKFTYDITLNNAGDGEGGPFEGTHIPWYGVNELFYHDDGFNYYQVTDTPSGQQLKTESGGPYPVTSSGFDVHDWHAQQITYRSGDEEITLTLYGNQMEASSDGKTATARLKINQSEVLNIANVPAGTTYEITEVTEPGYELRDLAWEVKDGDVALRPNNGKVGDTEVPVPVVTGTTISGTIVTNCDNHVEYKNLRNAADLEIFKVEKGSLDKDEKKYLEGAEFTVTMLDEMGQGEYKLVEANSAELVYRETFTSDAIGHITISGLNPGYYEIVETKVPDGYILTSQPEYIKVELGVVTRLSKTVNDESTENVNEGYVISWPENTDNGGMVHFTAARGKKDATYLIGNEPGVELPASGGPGTTVLTIVGAVLIAAAAATLGMRKRGVTA